MKLKYVERLKRNSKYLHRENNKNRYYYFLFCNKYNNKLDVSLMPPIFIICTCKLFSAYVENNRLIDWDILFTEMFKSIKIIEQCVKLDLIDDENDPWLSHTFFKLIDKDKL